MYGVTPQVDKDAGVGDGSPVYIVIGVYFDKARG